MADLSSIHTRRWVTFLGRRGHDVQLLVNAEHTVPPDVGDQVTVRRFGSVSNRGIPLLRSRSRAHSLRRLLREVNPDLLHAHYLSSFGWLAHLSGFHPRLVTAWGSDLLLDPSRSFRARLRARLILRNADMVTVPAEHMLAVAVAAGAKPARLRRVAFGVDTAVYAPGKPDEGVLASLGVLGRPYLFSPRAIRRIYRQDLVLSALARMPGDLLLVMSARNADPEHLAQLRAQAKRLELADRLRILEQVSDPQMLQLFRGAVAVVSVPESDGLPASVLEAMACAVPTIATDLPGPREALGPAAAHLVIPLGDRDALARTVTEVLGLGAAERASLGAAMRNRVVAHFDQEACMLEMERIYVSLRFPEDVWPGPASSPLPGP